jgi:hypothetical protein
MEQLEQCGRADEIAAGPQGHTAFRLGILQVIDAGEVAAE